MIPKTPRGRGKPATFAQKRRFVEIKLDGCLACHIDGNGYNAPEIHHLKSGNIRRGHEFTIGLCPWHHRACPIQFIESWYQMGPSLANGSRTFHEHYGSDDHLLQLQNERLRAVV
jgi:hypothetical protein